MKKTILLYLLTSLLAVKTNAQSTDWTKDDRNNIYNDCMGYIGKYQNLTTEQKESMSICYLDEITKKYTKKDYQNKIDIEIKKIRETNREKSAYPTTELTQFRSDSLSFPSLKYIQ